MAFEQRRDRRQSNDHDLDSGACLVLAQCRTAAGKNRPREAADFLPTIQIGFHLSLAEQTLVEESKEHMHRHSLQRYYDFVHCIDTVCLETSENLATEEWTSLIN